MPQNYTEQRAPWNLSQVCFRWRSIILAEPLLWNRIACGWIDDLNSIVPALTCLLSRSGQCSLTLELQPRTTLFNDVHLRDAILPHSHRITTLRIKLSSPSFPHWVPWFATGFRSLEVLAITCCGPISLPGNRDHLRLFQKSPALRPVCISGAVDLFIGNRFQLPWTQITALDFQSEELWVTTILRILETCPNMKIAPSTYHITNSLRQGQIYSFHILR
jgi:hypothetical protein